MAKLFTPIGKIKPIIIDASEPYPKGTKYYVVAGRECVNGYSKDEMNEFLAVKVLLYIDGKLIPNKSVAINVNSNDGFKIRSAIEDMENRLTQYKSRDNKILISQINNKAQILFKYINFYGKFILKKEIVNDIDRDRELNNNFINKFFGKIDSSIYLAKGKKYNYNMKVYFLENSKKYFILNEIQLLDKNNDILVSENEYYCTEDIMGVYNECNEFIFDKSDFLSMYYYKYNIPEENIEEKCNEKLVITI